MGKFPPYRPLGQAYCNAPGLPGFPKEEATAAWPAKDEDNTEYCSTLHREEQWG